MLKKRYKLALLLKIHVAPHLEKAERDTEIDGLRAFNLDDAEDGGAIEVDTGAVELEDEVTRKWPDKS